VQKKQAFEMLPPKNGIKWAVQEGWGATPFGKKGAKIGLAPNHCQIIEKKSFVFIAKKIALCYKYFAARMTNHKDGA
jgi:hypothetical protein